MGSGAHIVDKSLGDIVVNALDGHGPLGQSLLQFWLAS